MTDATSMSNSMTGTSNGLDVLALGATPSAAGGGRGKNGVGGAGGGSGDWFEAMASAWGQTLDQEAGKLETMSDGIGGGNEQPSQIAQLSAESLRMQFISQSENTSIGAAGQSLQTMARKD